MTRFTTAVTTVMVGAVALAGAVTVSTATASSAPSSSSEAESTHPSRSQQKRLVQDWLQLWNGDYTLAERIVSPDVRVHAALLDGGDGSAVKGPAGMADLIRQIRGAFPDLRFAVQVGPIIDGDHVVVRWVATGTYAGGFPGATAAVGTRVTFTGNDTLRVKRGRIAEYWLNADTLLLITQLKVKSN